ncbi:MAG: AMP phosphorylase [Desulfurococcales archaeon]|jgi:AMP phosphorylase
MKTRLIEFSFASDVALVHPEDARQMGIDIESRLLIRRNGMPIAAFSPMISQDLVGKGEIGIPKSVANALKLSDGEEVSAEGVTASESLNIMAKKTQGMRLSREEIRKLIADMVSGLLDDAAIAEFVTLQSTVGMDDDEIHELIRAMVETGNKIEFPYPVYDEHSIGGVPGNSKVALLAVPTSVALGLKVPKTSSRAITSPSGTADTMEALANVSLTTEEIRNAVEKAGGTIAWTGRLNLAPADDIMVRIERRLLLDPPSQVVASILSKKVSLGISGLVIDLPVGNGTKLQSEREAENLAAMFVKQGGKFNMSIKALITFGGEPIGYTIGPNLEAIEALTALMKGEASQSLMDKAMYIAGALYEMAGKANIGEGEAHARDAFKSGKSYEKFKKILEMQGGNPEVKPEDIPVGEYSETIYSNKSGAVTFIDNRALTIISRLAGAPLDKAAGIKLYVKIGNRVKSGDPLFKIYSSSSYRLSEALAFANSVKEIEIGTMLLKVFP